MARATAIRVYSGDALTDTLHFDREIIKIGRLASAHLRLEDKKVSRIHAVIEVHDAVSIIDMGSAEGTKVNGERISRQALSHGDEIILGDSRLVMVLDESEVLALRGGDAPAAEEEASGFEATMLTNPGIGGEIGALGDLAVPSDDGGGVFAGEDTGNHDLPSDAPIGDGATTIEPQQVMASVLAPPSADPPIAAPRASAPPQPQSAAPQGMTATAAMGPPAGYEALPPIPEDPITAENRHLEITLRWGGSVVEVKRLKETPKFSIGTAETDDLFVPLGEIGHDASHLLVTQAAGGSEWELHFLPSMSGVVRRGKSEVPLAQAGPGSFTITDDMFVEMSIGYFTLEIKNVSKSKVVPIVPFLDMFFLNSAVITLFGFASLMGVLLLMPMDLDDDDDDLFSNTNQFQTLILKKPPKDNAFLKSLEKRAKTKAAKDAGGKAGDKKAKAKDGRMAAKAKDKPTDEQVVSAKLNALFGTEGNSGIAQLFGASSGGELEAALGGISGSKVANSYGAGGLGVRGGGPGGGGVGVGTIGIGRAGTMGRGTGKGGYGAGVGGLGDKSDRAVKISQGTPVVMGSLDPEIIRRIVREHMAQIKYCYERELMKTPGLAGKISMKWIINANGKVQNATVAQTTMKSSPVEKCMARKIRTWRFPKPKGGGIVIVNYPFVFKRGG